MSGERWRSTTQTELLIEALREARALGRAVELHEIMRPRIAQHGSRLNEIRNRGFQVLNERESVDGVLRFRYWLERYGEQS